MSANVHETEFSQADVAERAVFAAIILNNDLWAGASITLRESDFRRPAHQSIWLAMQRLFAAGIDVDAVTLYHELAQRGVGGAERLIAEILTGVAKTQHIASHVDVVRLEALRRDVAGMAERLALAASNGADEDDLRGYCQDLKELFQDRSIRASAPTDLASASVTESAPRWLVDGLLMYGAVHLIWAAPGVGKSYLMLLALLQLATGAEHLWGVPEFTIRRRLDRLLFISHEETAGRMLYRTAAICRGLKTDLPENRVFQHFASQDDSRFTLANLEHYVEEHGPFDLIVLDTFTGLRPADLGDGRKVAWDLDNDAINALLRPLNHLARTTGTALVLVHHSNKAGKGFRGAIDLLASVDVSIELAKETDERDGARIKIHREKVRDGVSGDKKFIRTRWSQDTAGQTVLRIEPVRNLPSGTLDPKAMAILKTLAERGSLPQTKLAARIHASRDVVRDRCRGIESNGLIEEVGKENNSPVWRITDEGRACVEVPES